MQVEFKEFGNVDEFNSVMPQMDIGYRKSLVSSIAAYSRSYKILVPFRFKFDSPDSKTFHKLKTALLGPMDRPILSIQNSKYFLMNYELVRGEWNNLIRPANVILVSGEVVLEDSMYAFV